MPQDETYTIGKVVSRLKSDYPDLTVSKVRFLESLGLVTPKRTKSGYRMYSEEDVKRIEMTLRLQSRYFYPLSVIKERLDSVESIDEANIGAIFGESASFEGNVPSGPIALEDAPTLLGISVPFVRSLADNGLIRLSGSNIGRQTFDGGDAPLIKAAAELKSYGIDPRFLKPYVQRANRDVPLFKQTLSAQMGRKNNLDDEGTRREFDDTLDRLIQLTNCIGECITRREVRAEFNYPKE